MGLSSHPVSSLLRWLMLLVCAGWAASAPAQVRGQASATFETERNVYVAGARVRPAHPVAGDFVAAAGRIVIDQSIGGDATLAAGTIDVRAPIGDDLRVGGGDLNVESTVGGELFAAGGTVTLSREAVIAHSARMHGSHVIVDGRIDGGLKGSADTFTINGEVRGDVDVAASQVELGPQAKIGGALRYRSSAELKRAEGATVAGAVTRASQDRGPGPQAERGQPPMKPRHGAGMVVGGLLSYLGLLACGALLLLVAPRFSRQAPERIRSAPWLSLGVGFAAVIAAPVLAVLLFVTLLGIPLGLIVLALYPVLMLAGFLVGALFIAHLMPQALRQEWPHGFARAIGWLALALLAVLLLSRLPVAGGLLLALVTCAGMGACAVELYGRRHAGPPMPPGPAAQGAV